MKRLVYLFLAGFLVVSCAKEKVYEMSDFGILPGCLDASPLFEDAMRKIMSEKQRKPIVIRFEKGRYDFREEHSILREYFISNHDQENPKRVGLALEDLHNVTIDGQGSDFVFHGRMLPLSLLRSENCVLKNFSIDFAYPHIVQVKILKNDEKEGITFELAPWYNYRINGDSAFETFEGENRTIPFIGIAFEPATKHLLYNCSDLSCDLTVVSSTGKSDVLQAPKWKDARLKEGTVVALRTWFRPAPGIFMSENKNTEIRNVKVHYAEGMGLLAQSCENIVLDSFGVCLKGNGDPRYFTTQADATHFSGCKGKLISRHGLYENMMDDAINVHGTYLKLTRRLDVKTVEGTYMHPQSWGFKWGEIGDTVQFVRSSTMENEGLPNRIVSIEAKDAANAHGAKTFVITFENPLDSFLNENAGLGMENLTWTPEVEFSNNIVRNNRARGALFSTPQKVLVESNLFDHTSGTAILLCGDCNGWFETGACHDVMIKGNTFINSLTNQFQFTNAIISIYPEIPDLQNQRSYFHSNVRIENNTFKTFDVPIVYAKSLGGLVFTGNKVEKTFDYKPFHWNAHRFFLQRVVHVTIQNNEMEGGFDAQRDVRAE